MSAHFNLRPWLCGVLLLVCGLTVALSSTHSQGAQIAVVSAASFGREVAPDSIAAAFGANFSTSVVTATTLPLPTTLGGTSVRVNGQLAALFFVSPGQLNFLLPASTAVGAANLAVTTASGATVTGAVEIKAAAPAIFTANANGQGVPAAVLLRVAANGMQTTEPIIQFDAATNRFIPKPISLCVESEKVFLILFLSGSRRATAGDVRVLLGGQAVRPDYSGAQGGFAGLDQINVELPRSLLGSGLVKVAVTAPGAAASNETEIEMAPPCGARPPRITSLSATTLLAGQELIINGADFSAVAAENSVQFSGDGTQPQAQLSEASPTRLRVLVPFGAGSGRVSVRTPLGEGEAPAPVTLRTSLSGFIQDNKRQAIRGVTLRAGGLTATTNAEGAFVLPDAPVSDSLIVEVDGTTATGGNYVKELVKLPVRAARDNQFPGYIELKQAIGPSVIIGAGALQNASLSTQVQWRAPNRQIQNGQVILDIPDNAVVRFPDGGTSGALTLSLFESGRTPGTLPTGQFSPVIAQITPFGATITPGAKLTFPNPDGYAANSRVKLFRFDQRQTVNGQPNPTLGTFIEAGDATVSADGQRIESAANAVVETSYYFASGVRPTVTLIGRVVESNLNRTPVRRSLVNARGQGIFTDGNGGFVIRNVPVNASSALAAQLSGELVIEAGLGEVVIADDRIGVEADFMRPSTRVDRSQQENVPPVGAGPTVSPDLILSSVSANRPPTIFAPASVTMNAGTTREVTFFASDPDAGQTVQVTVGGASFATVSRGTADNFTLRLTPGANDAGNYILTLTASDGQSGASTQVALRVNGIGVTADDQVVTVDKNTPKAITLTGSDPANRPLAFSVTSQPAHGALSGAAPNLTYTPLRDYVGMDSFTFKVRAGQAESNEAKVEIRVPGVALTAPGAQRVNGGETLKFTVSASSSEANGALQFTVNGRPGEATIVENPRSLQFSWTPVINQAGTYEVTFTATGNGFSDSRRVPITVEAKWAKTAGPEWGSVTSFAAAGGALYAGTAGGVYRSNDNAQSWTAVNNGLAGAALFVRALHAAGGSLLAGTAEGVYQSSDGGQNWTALNNGLTDQALDVRALQTIGNSLFAGTYGGVFRSSNNGQNWTPVNSGLTGGALLVNTLQAFSGNLYAGANSGVYRSSDGGQSWTALSNGLPGEPLVLSAAGNNLFVGTRAGGVARLNDNGQGWTALNNGLPTFARTIQALAATGNVLFAGAADGGGLYRSNDNGQSWTPVSSGLRSLLNIQALFAVGGNLLAGTDEGVYRSSDAGNDWRRATAGLAAAAIPALCQTGGRLFASTGGRLSVSSNGGQSWAEVNAPTTLLSIEALHALGGHLFAGTLGRGVFRSSDAGQNWTPVNNGLPNPVFLVLALHSIGNNLFAGTTRNGVFRSSDNGQTWLAVNNGLTGAALTITSLQSLGNTLLAGTSGGVYRSSDNGQNWTPVNNGLTGNALRVSALQAAGANLFAGTANGVYRSSDNGQNWTALNNGLTGAALSILALSATDSGLFAGTFGGGAYRFNDSGQNWTPVNNGLPPGVWALYATGGNLFAGTVNGVYRSNNNGQNWTAANNGLERDALFIQTLSATGGALFAGAFHGGVYHSNDNGQSWIDSSNGLAGSSPFSNGLNVQALLAAGGNLLLGSSSGGVYRSSDNGQSWTAASNGLPRGALNVRALQASGANLLLGSSSGGVYRSSDNGQNWTAVNNGLTGRALEILALHALGNSLFAGTLNGGVYRSNDNGQSWLAVNNGLTGAALGVNALHVLGSNLFAGTAGGAYRSSDNGQTWVQFSAALTQPEVLTLAADGAQLFAGTNGSSVFALGDTTQSWTESNSGLSNRFVNTVTVSSGSYFAGTLGGGVFRSPDQGQSWTRSSTGLPDTNVFSLLAESGALWAATFGDGVFRSANNGGNWAETSNGLTNKFVTALAARGGQLFAATTTDPQTNNPGGIFVSTNNGATWTASNNGLSNRQVNTLAVTDAGLLAGTDGGGVFASNDNGASWTARNAGLSGNAFSVRAFAAAGNALFAATNGGGVYRSVDGGGSWTAINNSLPTGLNVCALAASGRKIYAGSIYGVFVTEDEGRSWRQINAGLLNTYVTGLAVSGEQLLASTASGGVFLSRIPQ